MSTFHRVSNTTTRARALGLGALMMVAAGRMLAAQSAPHFMAPDSFVSNGSSNGPSTYWSAAGDFNGDGFTDLVAPDGLAINNSLGFTVVYGQPGGFSAPVPRTVNTYVHATLAADFNHDGCSDLLLATASGGIVLLGGPGGFGAPNYLGTSANNGAIADFNGDGNPDIVSAGDNGYYVSIGDGAGGFAPATLFREAAASYWVVVGDFNGDGAVDFTGAAGLVGNTYLGNGDGTFQAPFSNGMPPVVGTIAADFNRDGRLDLVMLTAQPRQEGSNYAITISIGWGDGTFSRYSNYVFSQPLRGLVVADFNDDGIPDVATHVTQTGKIRVFAGDGALGVTGDLIDSPVVTTGALLGADVDGNGSTDLVMSDYREFKVFRSTHGQPPLVAALSLTPSAVIGGGASTGVVQLGGSAPAGGAVITLVSSDASLVTFPNGPTVTIPAGASSATFAIATAPAGTAASVAVSATWNGVTQVAAIGVVPGYALSGLTISPSSQYGIFTATGTVTLSQPADSSATVSLTSANPALASVPASVTVPAGATTTTFAITLRAVSADTAVEIVATRAGARFTSPLTVLKPRDTVTISKAIFTAKTTEVKIEASSTSSTTTLTVYNTATGALVGSLANAGGGKYKGSVFLLDGAGTAPSITLKSALGGTVTARADVK